MARLERPKERGKGVEARTFRHFLQCVIGVGKKPLGMVNAQVVHVFVERSAAVAVEILAEIRAVCPYALRHVREFQSGSEVQPLLHKKPVQRRAYVV